MAFSIPRLTSYYSSVAGSPSPDSDYDSHYWRTHEEVISALNEIRVLPRWPMQNARAVRDNATDLLRVLVAVEFRYNDGFLLTKEDQLAVSMHSRLHELVFRAGPIDDSVFDAYVRDGIPMPPD